MASTVSGVISCLFFPHRKSPEARGRTTHLKIHQEVLNGYLLSQLICFHLRSSLGTQVPHPEGAQKFLLSWNHPFERWHSSALAGRQPSAKFPWGPWLHLRETKHGTWDTGVCKRHLCKVLHKMDLTLNSMGHISAVREVPLFQGPNGPLEV